MKNGNQQSARRERGFFLIEMIVSMSIFIIVLLMIVGALVSLNGAARGARAIRLVNDNLGAAIDSMSRNIRMGTYLHCGCPTDASNPDPAEMASTQNCIMSDDLGAGGGTCLAFEGQYGDPWSDTDQVVYKAENGRLWRSLDSAETFSPLTAPEIVISTMRFYVQGTTLKKDQPVVTMVIRGTANAGKSYVTNFNIQTTIGAREPNYNKIY